MLGKNNTPMDLGYIKLFLKKTQMLIENISLYFII